MKGGQARRQRVLQSAEESLGRQKPARSDRFLVPSLVAAGKEVAPQAVAPEEIKASALRASDKDVVANSTRSPSDPRPRLSQ